MLSPVPFQQRTLAPPPEQRVVGDQPVLLEDADLVGEAVDLDHPPAGRIGTE